MNDEFQMTNGWVPAERGAGRQAVVVQAPLALVSLCWTLNFLGGCRIRLRFASARQAGHRGGEGDFNRLNPFPLISTRLNRFPPVSTYFLKNYFQPQISTDETQMGKSSRKGREGRKAFEDEEDCRYAKRPMKTKKLNQIKPNQTTFIQPQMNTNPRAGRPRSNQSGQIQANPTMKF